MPTDSKLRPIEELRPIEGCAEGLCPKSYNALCGQCALQPKLTCLRSWIRLLDPVAKAPLRFTKSRGLWAGVPCFRSLGLPFIQERLAFLSRPREADVLMSLLPEPRDHVSDLGRIDDVHHLSIRSVGEDGNQPQHCLLPLQDLGATLRTPIEFGLWR